MPVPSPGGDRENNALWSLLVTQAEYKLLMKIPSDSLVRVAYDYYKTTDNARRKAMSALYMGGVTYDMGNAEEATRFYLEAKSEMEKTTDYKLGYLIMSGLGNIYLYRELVDYAFDACNQAYDYAIKDSNKRYQTTSLRYIARCYYLRGNLEESIHTYQSASKLALELNEDDFYCGLQLELAMVYTNSQRFGQALTIAKELPFSSQKLLLMGQTYLSLNKVDSAYSCLKMGLHTDNIYTRKSIYEVLYKLCGDSKYNKYMKDCCDSLLLYKDSIMVLDKSREIIAYQEKYNKEKLISEKRKLELEKADVVNWWMLTIVVTLFLTIILVCVYVRKKIFMHRQEEKLADLTLQLHKKESEIDKIRLYITELESQSEEINKKDGLLSELEERLCKLKKENEHLCLEKELLYEKISSYSTPSCEVTNIKTLSNKLCQSEKRENELCSQLLNQNPLIRNLHLKPIYLNDVALRNICKIADEIFSNFTKRLLKDFPALSEHELVLCCLIKLRFSITEMSIFLNIASTSVSRSKLRIKNKIYLELDEKTKEKSFDMWIMKY